MIESGLKLPQLHDSLVMIVYVCDASEYDIFCSIETSVRDDFNLIWHITIFEFFPWSSEYRPIATFPQSTSSVLSNKLEWVVSGLSN